MDKFICNRCNFLLTIRKIINNKKIFNPNDLLIAYKNQDQEYELKFDKPVLENFLLTKKNLKDSEKKKIIKFFDSFNDKKEFINMYILKCSTCSSEFQLKPETIIYSFNFKKHEAIFDDDDIDLKIYDPTLPRTKDYICKNKDCITNKNGFDLKNKEAVFYRARSSYITKYACVNCKTSWII